MTFLSQQSTAASDAAQGKFLGGEEKTAVLGAALLSALGGHLGTNIAGRAAHHGSNLAELMAHRGFQHGLLGQSIHPARQLSMKSLLGPESLATYEAARLAGSKAVEQFPNPHIRNAHLTALHAGSGTQSHLANTPVISPIRDAIKHELLGTSPQLRAEGPLSKLYSHAVNFLADHTQTGFETGAQKAVGMLRGAAPTIAATAAEPIPMMGHYTVNMGRELASRTRAGEKFMRNEVAEGLRGNMPSKAQQLAVDISVSPALLDARRAANDIRGSLPPAVNSYVADNMHHIEDPWAHLNNAVGAAMKSR